MVDKLFRKSQLLCSNDKSGGYSYKPLKEAVTHRFIQFNAHAVTTISIDIDHCTKEQLEERLKLIPTPSIIVTTSKGFHIHYLLTYPVSYKRPQLVRWATFIKEELSRLVGGDKHAGGLKRIYRNPALHECTFNDVTYTLSQFGIVPSKTNKAVQSSRATIAVDFSTVKRGGRHMALFDYVRSHAYKYSKSDDLRGILEFIADEANNKMEEPLSNQEVSGIINSVCRFMENVYCGASDSKTEYNRKLAKDKHTKTITACVSSLHSVGLKHALSMSARALAKIAKVSNSTLSLYRTKIFELLTNLVRTNIALSVTAYQQLMVLVYSYLLLDTRVLLSYNNNNKGFT